MTRKYDNPPDLFQSAKYGFSQLVTSSAGRLFATSGQVAIDSHERVIGNTLHAQLIQALTNLKALLDSGGGNLSDIISLRIYVVQSQEVNLNVVGEVLREYFGTEEPPCASWIGVAFLARKEFLVEVEAIGVFPD
jgi:enamine deaminase RidA (YjgF/YER057c/UK114 family)